MRIKQEAHRLVSVLNVPVEAAVLGRLVAEVAVVQQALHVRRHGEGRVRLVVEVHIPAFRGNLYGRTLSLTFLSKIRSERRFASLGALKAQIRKDVASLNRKAAYGTIKP